MSEAEMNSYRLASMGTIGNVPKRYYTIDIARAIAIILVVIGHYCEPDMPKGYIMFHDIIYLFHMPLFLFISGYLYIVSRGSEQGYFSFINKKVKRLVIPYFTTSIVIVLIKLVSQKYIPVDNPVTVVDFITIFYLPSAGYFLWFLWVLWWCMLIIPLFKSTRMILGLLGVSLILYVISAYVTEYLCLRQLCANMLYFVIGCLSAVYFSKKGLNFGNASKYFSIILFCIMAIVFYPYFSHFNDTIAQKLIMLFFALFGIIMSLSLSNILNIYLKGKLRALTLSVSLASFFIYQYHTTFEGFVKGVINKINLYSEPYLDIKFSIGIILVTGSGVILPYILDRKFISRHKLTRLIFGV